MGWHGVDWGVRSANSQSVAPDADIARGTVAVLSSGQASYHPTTDFTSDAADCTASVATANLPSNLLCLASSSKGNSTFAVAGKEVDVSVFDVERTFGQSAANGAQGVDVEMASGKSVKRKKEALLPGETWRARNVGPQQYVGTGSADAYEAAE